MAKVAIGNLLDAGVHFGHQTRRWNPKMKPYIYGSRKGITIFDLTVTMKLLAEACKFLRDTVAEGGDILFVGTKRQAQEAVREAAEKTGMHAMCNRWLGGTLTNSKVVTSRVSYLKKLRKMEADGEFDSLPKKEVSKLRREKDKLERALGGITEMRKPPAALVIIDIEHEHIAVAEANRMGIPVVAVVDSNCDPQLVDCVVPGNDDAVKAIRVVLNAMAYAVEAGNMVRGKEVAPPAAAAEQAPAATPADAAEAPAAGEGEAAPVPEPAGEPAKA